MSDVVADGESTLPDKRRVAASFSRAAASYDAVAELQRAVGNALIERLPDGLEPNRWLDLGCGTGYFSRRLAQCFPHAKGVSLDIAEGMLRHARPQGGAEAFIAGDAECLPLRDGCVDLVFSSLALQWCENFPAVLREARRALRPGGVFAFSSLCAGTLHELRDSWQAVDGFAHVNRFRTLDTYQRLCADSDLKLTCIEVQPQVLHFAELRRLTYELKALGAHNLNPGRPDGLTGPARIRALIAAYEQFRTPSGLPATYQVVYGVLRKES